MLFSGHEWDYVPDGPAQGGGIAPSALRVQLSGPGNLGFYSGAHCVLTLQRGRMEGHGFLQLPRVWEEGRFRENQQLAGPAAAGLLWMSVQEECLVQFVLHMPRPHALPRRWPRGTSTDRACRGADRAGRGTPARVSAAAPAFRLWCKLWSGACWPWANLVGRTTSSPPVPSCGL
jgi:hypothetical protein